MKKKKDNIYYLSHAIKDTTSLEIVLFFASKEAKKVMDEDGYISPPKINIPKSRAQKYNGLRDLVLSGMLTRHHSELKYRIVDDISVLIERLGEIENHYKQHLINRKFVRNPGFIATQQDELSKSVFIQSWEIYLKLDYRKKKRALDGELINRFIGKVITDSVKKIPFSYFSTEKPTSIKDDKFQVINNENKKKLKWKPMIGMGYEEPLSYKLVNIGFPKAKRRNDKLDYSIKFCEKGSYRYEGDFFQIRSYPAMEQISFQLDFINLPSEYSIEQIDLGESYHIVHDLKGLIGHQIISSKIKKDHLRVNLVIPNAPTESLFRIIWRWKI